MRGLRASAPLREIRRVLNAFRHHGWGGQPSGARRVYDSCAQRLSASRM